MAWPNENLANAFAAANGTKIMLAARATSWPTTENCTPRRRVGFGFGPNPIRNACHLRLERNGSRTNAERENPFGAHAYTQRQIERERERHVGKFEV